MPRPGVMSGSVAEYCAETVQIAGHRHRIRRKARPISPPRARTCERSATHRLMALSPHVRNAKRHNPAIVAERVLADRPPRRVEIRLCEKDEPAAAG